MARKNAHNEDDRGLLLVGVACSMVTLCTVAVISRVLARRKTKVKLGADDYWVFLAHWLLVGLAVEYFFLVHYGIGKHSKTLTPDEFVSIAKVDLATRLTYGTTLTVAKVSVLMLYRRLFSLRENWFRIGWWANVTFIIAYFVAFILENLIRCVPLSRLWSHHNRCKTSFTAGEVFGAFNAAIDLAILVLPIRTVWGLHLPSKQKLAVCGIFSLGLIGVIVSIIRVPSFRTVVKADYTYTAIVPMIWNMTEPAVAIICACLPILRSLFSEFPKEKPFRNYSFVYPPSVAKNRISTEGEDARPINSVQGTPLNHSAEGIHFPMADYSDGDSSTNEERKYSRSRSTLNV